MTRRSKPQKGFTLIELLIVVAIIAILAAIAVPNFLEAQVRAKVSRTHNDLRALAVAMEAYFVDWNSYTYSANQPTLKDPRAWRQLTTPVAYIGSVPVDPFGEARRILTGARLLPWYGLGTGAVGVGNSGFPPSSIGRGFPSDTWMLSGCGPDKFDDTVAQDNSRGNRWNWAEGVYPWADGRANDPVAVSEALSVLYDPTNGTVSWGNLLRLGGMKPGGGVFDVLYANCLK